MSELASIKQCFTILKKYPIFFAGPRDLDYNRYLELAKDYQVTAVSVRFANKYFRNIAGYNKLLLSPYFYKAWRKYQYMLVYQPDSWVFRDELSHWCDKGFDYIGSPWFEGWGLPMENAQILRGGNGGFSLRKVESYIRILYSFSYISPLRKVWNNIFDANRGWLKIPLNLFRFVLNSTVRNNTFYLFNWHTGNEDGFWVFFASRNFSWYKVADKEHAIAFGFEMYPARLYEMNNHQLPFGCHAWEKYEPEFWKPFIHV